jgi:hypothetical protein
MGWGEEGKGANCETSWKCAVLRYEQSVYTTYLDSRAVMGESHALNPYLPMVFSACD